MKIDHLNISTNKINDMIQFYAEHFDLKIVEEGEYNGLPHVIIGHPERFYLCLYQTDESLDKKVRINHIGVNVTDFGTFLSKIKAKKIPLLYNGLTHYPQSDSFYIADPDGNEIEISSKFGGR
ncbi:MAG: hypothetical protein COW00_14305 [Bdellovibrio sp. CG12_big_fil_rev_8_21_14_0_65_39_13]|nr:MAG: hypothetical protein COW78_07950 [Bdellovibrio sp. CG22_combo_CG10-13_8_21_14_all_39_27]PIQ58785.1 MAG: hypothetical protein COW00_14305 [Bdellovibrio sp. CG12_big_fil_rev_8_21_14_0_65_39_13]PIR35534.1 MAG: hypothetical protein COV37_08655 [Bdellovibrio sp. CG11_big_fil_rev_8_21_14_0_20_39_38]PJB52914.1 MAG: hypothetical protein CO099_10045 [Bdellovibrio sp. CG_4_9_14_3_um_filter_39_7]